ncbi:MAG: V-type ATP synthase subunit I [Brevinematia bacterium]
MVEKMKKISVLIYEPFKEVFLEGLQDVGVVDLNVDLSKENDKILSIKKEIFRIKKAKDFVSSFLRDEKKAEKPVVFESMENLLNRIENLQKEYETLTENIKSTDDEIKTLEKWGEFDPIIFARLEEERIHFKFYSCTTEEFEKLKKEDYVIEEVNKIGNIVYFVLFSTEEIELSEPKVEKVPMKKLSEVRTYRNHLETLLKENILSIKSLGCYIQQLNEEMNILSDELFFEIGREGFTNLVEDKVLYITGYFPVKSEKKLVEFLEKNDVIYIIETPSMTENVPVKLKNDKFSSLFETITKLNSLPQYYEIDPTPFTAPFFALFFGLCIADVGYGIILLMFSFFAFLLIKDRNLKSIALLGVVLSIATIIAGIILNTFFGMEILKLSVPAELKKLVLFTDMNSAMGFAILLGVIQVAVGYILQIVNKMRLHGVVGGLQPLGTFLLFTGVLIYSILFLIEGDVSIGPIAIKKILGFIPFPKIISGVMVISGLLLVLLFNNLGMKIYFRPLVGLWELYGIVTGVPGDILSYLRLFALGLAGGLLGNAFNQIALMARGDGKSIPGMIGMILILTVGHGLNLVLAVLGAFVHPLRLTLLEFYKALGYTGGGRPYRPFRKTESVK